jgi:hypothetical protein
MIVNFLFDDFVGDDTSNPWYNMPDIPREKFRNEEGKYLPKNFGWWYTDIADTLTSNNPLPNYENEIRFVKSLEHGLKTDEINIYPIFVSDKVFEAPNVLLWLPRYIVDQVNEGLLHLIILNYFEADHVDHYRLYSNYRYYLSESGITNFKNVAILGNSYISNVIINQLAIESNDLRYINCNSCESYYAPYFHKNSVDILTYQNEKKSKIFLMQIGSGRPWRYFTLKYLEYLGVLDNSLYSYIMREPSGIDTLTNHKTDRLLGASSTLLDELYIKDTKFAHWLIQHGDITAKRLPNCQLDINNAISTSSYMDPNWITDTYFSVVCEAQMNNYNGIITEKTFRMIYYGHPFIIVGSPGILKELHNLGYKTFPELFNESYDDMYSTIDKIKFITEQVTKWCDPSKRSELNQIMKDIQPKLEHNRNLYISKDHSKFWNYFKYKEVFNT